MSLEQQIIKVIANTLNKDESTIHPNSRFIDDLGAESVELVSLMMEIQSNFNCNISDNDAVNLRTVADTVKYVQENRDS